MSFLSLKVNEVGRKVLMTGNEAICRGAIEAGLGYASSYPGSPTAEILANLGKLAGEHNFYAEWSVHEKVAVEGAAAASFAGMRSLCVVKPNGYNVAMDSIAALSISGIKAGMVLVVGDDPAGHSSTNEEDSRYLSKVAHLPILEPSNPEEAKLMTIAALELSEQLKLPVTLRCVTRICHASGNVTIGEIRQGNKAPHFDLKDQFVANILLHTVQEMKLAKAREMYNLSPFNSYYGPKEAKTLIIASGPSFMYAKEAVKALQVEDRVGIFKLGTIWPLPDKLILEYLKPAEQVVFVEEIEPFNEENIMHLAAQHIQDLYPIQFFGQKSGYMAGSRGPGIGEMDPDIVIQGLANVVSMTAPCVNIAEKLKNLLPDVPNREMAFCAGCPHRASFWALKSALAVDGREGVVLGDIGCYSLALRRTGWSLPRTMHAMGSGVGIASGLGKLDRFGFDQPVVAVCGDSTFYHSAISGLINARYNKSNFLLMVLDNSTTAMTGHQPHPGLGRNAMEDEVGQIPIEKMAAGLDIPVHVEDPYDVASTTEKIFELLNSEGTNILVLRRTCALVTAKETTRPRVYVDQEVCIGDSCGCNRFCSRTYSCPASIWDNEKGIAAIDDVVCNRCQVCVSLCPRGAIKVEGGETVAK